MKFESGWKKQKCMLTKLFNNILEPKECEGRKRTLVLVYKNRGDSQNYTTYRGIKLTNHTRKLYESIIEQKLRHEPIYQRTDLILRRKDQQYKLYTYLGD